MKSSQSQTQSQSQSTPVPDLPKWPSSYTNLSSTYDEFLDEKGQPRPHWQTFSDALTGIDSDSLVRRETQLNRSLLDNGITYNLYNQNNPRNQSSTMDMMPFLLPESEFKAIESALSQRARLQNTVLSDFYTRQTIIEKHEIDPFLVYANPTFQRPAHGLLSSRENHIQIYAADITRSASGKWWVLSDRVEATSGLGYALENRLLISRIFPKILRETSASQLNPFLQDFCSNIRSIAKQNKENPNIALLSPGPASQTYHEHSFLARNLGYTLAEGSDLTVRNNRLYMKTIGGTQPIDVLIRRIDSEWIDPLEMRNDSLQGVPGLVNCVRQGNLAIANSLGSGVIESPALLAFLSKLCRSHIGEELEIPSVATWWCGQPRELEYVLKNLNTLAIKPAFRNYAAETLFGPNLTNKQLADLRAKIIARPQHYCGQEILKYATTPVYRNNQFEPRPFQLRVFLARQSDGSWKMMPGGFATCAADITGVNFSIQLGACSSKDVWVVPDQKVKSPPTPLKEAEPETKTQTPAQIQRRSFDLPSRTAEDLFWLGRYIERAEMQSRLLRTLIGLLLDEQTTEIQNACLPLMEQLIGAKSSAKDFLDPATDLLDITKVEQSIAHYICAPENPESLLNNLYAIERTGQKLKERLSIDAWKRIFQVSQITKKSTDLQVSIYDQETTDLLDWTLEALTSITGTVTENMTRSQSWRFLQLGRRIERGITTAKLLSDTFKDSNRYSDILFQSLLELCDCSITYRRRYLNTLNAIPLLDLMVFDATNPRSLMFQMENLRDLVKQLPHAGAEARHPADVTATQLFSQIGITSSEKLIDMNSPDGASPTTDFFASISSHLAKLSGIIVTRYFAHTQSEHQSKNTIPLG